MHFALTSAVLLGAIAVSAAPYGSPGKNGAGPEVPAKTTTAASSGQTLATFPLANGFPTLSPAELNKTEVAAHGTLGNGGLPKQLNPDSIKSFGLIAFNEQFEVAFFTSLLSNVTNNVPGYDLGNRGLRKFVIRTLTAVVAQEELHATGANGILKSAGATQIQPCEYRFPVATFEDAIKLASTFTDVVLGTLQDVQNVLATDGDSELVTLIGSVIGQEGEQNGYYRSLEDKIPSELPFLTRSTREFAFSAVTQGFVVPGSCPNADIIGLPVFGALTIETANIKAQDQDLQFSITNTNASVDIDPSSLSVVYINQQNVPVVEPLKNVKTVANSVGQTVTFDAVFPFTEHLLNGLTIAAVTNCAGPFKTADEVAKATVFGPGLIEIN